jgi:hypothetical protein
MISDGTQTMLQQDDMPLLEMLFERKLSDDLKSFLLDVFGYHGIRNNIRKMQDEVYEKCKTRYACGECGICSPYLQDAIIVHITEFVDAYENGLLDLDTGMIAKPKEDPNCPF